MTNWLGLEPFVYTVLRVAIVWLAFYGAGIPFAKLNFFRRYFRLMPSVVHGMLFYSLIALLLSLFGIMTRTVVSLLLVPGVVYGLLSLVHSVRKKSSLLRKLQPVQIFLGSVLFLVVLSSLMFASIPNVQFDDPQVIYAVRPDLWLSSGSIHWLHETNFSGFPFMAELISIFPAALSSDRLDQLSILQVFQFSMLFASIIAGLKLIGVKKKMFFVTSILIIHVSLLTISASYAKTDITCMFFVTIAFASIVRGILLRQKSFDYTPFLALGLAFSSKLTSALFFIPFIMYAVPYFKNKFSLKTVSVSVFVLAVVPVLFGIRTMVVTGSPTYPIFPVKQLLSDEYNSPPEPEEIHRGNDRAGNSSLFTILPVTQNVGIFFAIMEGVFLLFFAGSLIAVFRKSPLAWLSLPILVYSIIAMFVYWPPWWGAKYTIQLYPFIGILGAYYAGTFLKRPMLLASPILVASILVPGFIIAPSTNANFPASLRYVIAKSFVTGNWNPGRYNFAGLYFQSPEVITHLWMNEVVPENSTILSLHQEKRYFSDNKVIVAWRHPQALSLFLDNSIDEEIAILENLDVNYVTFYRNDPLPFELENNVVLLDHIGTGMVLEPIHIIQEFVICRFNPNGNKRYSI